MKISYTNRLALCAVTLACTLVAVGVLSATGWVGPEYGLTIYNLMRRFEWETLSAGLFGLSGGLFVIDSVKIQIEAQRKAFAESVLLEVDLCLHQLKHGLQHADEVSQRKGEKLSIKDMQQIKLRALNEELLSSITENPKLPQILKNKAYSSVTAAQNLVKLAEGFYQKSMPLRASEINARIENVRSTTFQLENERDRLFQTLTRDR